MCKKITWELDYKLALVRSTLSAILGTVALSLGRNVAGCSPLWGWTVAVVVISYCSALSLSCQDLSSIREKAKDMSNKQIGFSMLVMGFPTVVLMIMGLVTLGSSECREKWESRNAFLLYYSVINGVVACILVTLDLFLHECWDRKEENVWEPDNTVRPPPFDPSAPRVETPYSTGGDLYITQQPRYIDEEGR